MRKLIPGLVVLGLTGCTPPSLPSSVEYDMTVKSVEFPAQAQPTAPLDVVVEVEVGGCNTFKRLELVSRTSSQLKLRAVGTRPEGQNVVCPAYLRWQKVTYTDPGTPPRTNPFEVVVNGTSWGTVAIR